MSHAEDVRCWRTAEGALARAVQRPDGAWLLRMPADQPGAWPALVEAATQDGCGTLLLHRPANQSEAHERALRLAGFTPARTETRWRISVSAIPITPAARAEHQVLPVTEFDPRRVAALDNAIRADIPGTSGWKGTGTELTDSFDDPDFDPALYLVAHDPAAGCLDGLIRVWNRQPEPRLGCVGVTRSRRRTSLALLLLQSIASTLRDRGVTHITAETDDTNRASHLMALNHGGTAVETVVEWRRPSHSRPGDRW